MSTVLLENVTKTFDTTPRPDSPRGVPAVRDVSLEVRSGELLVLVGPSGSGKSTVLRLIAGLEEPEQGEISIGDRLVTGVREGKITAWVEPKDRDIAMVFQNYALYPHMSVYDNLAFGLKMRRTPREEIKQRVAEAAKVLGIEALLARKPRQLSGGERQRVALGRAIVRHPQVFLFDEPLSNLDASLRVGRWTIQVLLQRVYSSHAHHRKAAHHTIAVLGLDHIGVAVTQEARGDPAMRETCVIEIAQNRLGRGQRPGKRMVRSFPRGHGIRVAVGAGGRPDIARLRRRSDSQSKCHRQRRQGKEAGMPDRFHAAHSACYRRRPALSGGGAPSPDHPPARPASSIVFFRDHTHVPAAEHRAPRACATGKVEPPSRARGAADVDRALVRANPAACDCIPASGRRTSMLRVLAGNGPRVMADFDLILRGGTVVTAEASFVGDVAIIDGTIAALGTVPGSADRVIDATGCHVMPGGVDVHAHIEQMSGMGLMNADTFETATRSAALGGTTSVISFAAQAKGQSLRATVEDYAARARRGAMIDHAFHMTVTDLSVPEFETDLRALIAEGHRSIKVFTTYNIRLEDTEILRLMAIAREAGALVCVHAETDAMLGWAKALYLDHGLTAPRHHALSHPRLAEVEAVERMCRFAEFLDQPVMLFHISTREALAAVRAARGRGVPIWAETCPHYLLMTAAVLDRDGIEGGKWMCSPRSVPPTITRRSGRGLPCAIFR